MEGNWQGAKSSTSARSSTKKDINGSLIRYMLKKMLKKIFIQT